MKKKKKRRSTKQEKTTSTLDGMCCCIYVRELRLVRMLKRCHGLVRELFNGCHKFRESISEEVMFQ
jgi:hypothetical protein